MLPALLLTLPCRRVERPVIERSAIHTRVAQTSAPAASAGQPRVQVIVNTPIEVIVVDGRAAAPAPAAGARLAELSPALAPPVPPRAVPAPPIGPNPPQPDLVLAENDELVIIEEVVDNNGVKTRKSRNFSYWNFVERIDTTNAYCCCGCVETNGMIRKKYSFPHTGHVRKHIEKVHKDFYDLFQKIKNNQANLNELIEKIASANSKALNSTEKRRRLSGSFMTKASKLDQNVTGNLRLTMWAVASGISRNALNDPLFDAYLSSIGVIAAPNRHAIQDTYLPELDNLVMESIHADLADVKCVSLSSDGWRDLARRDWINVVITFIKSDPKLPWKIVNIEPDLIFLPTSATGDTIAYLINGTLENIVII